MNKAPRDPVTAIIGLGYVGLPLALDFCEAGLSVLGFDTDAAKVEKLDRGESYISYLLGEGISRHLAVGRFQPTGDFSRLGEADNIIITVPTPLDRHRNPDLSFVESTARTIAAHLRPGQLVVLESTTYPGTTREVILPLLEETGLAVGSDFFLAYCPERVDPNNREHRLRDIPRVVGGITEPCRERALSLYGQVVEELVPVSSVEAAEASKLLENIFRSVNIALVNEMKLLFDRMGIDVWEVIRASSSKPFGYMPFYPGPGLGGHCLPIDPFYLTWKAREFDFNTRFVELAGEVNVSMPYHVVQRTVEALNQRGQSVRGAQVLVLGAAYKKDLDDIRESPAVKIITLLQEQGARVSYHDPYIPAIRDMRHYPDLVLDSVELDMAALETADCVLVVTDHSCLDYEWVLEHSSLVVDTRNVMPRDSAKVVKA